MAVIDSGIGEIGLVINAADLEQLPVERSMDAVTLLAPGVSRGDEAFTGTSFSGSSVAENTSFISGLNTTNFEMVSAIQRFHLNFTKLSRLRPAVTQPSMAVQLVV